MAEHDPLRSGAIFRLQSQQYAAVRSPVPRVLPRAQSLGRPIPVYANAFGTSTFCRAKSLPPPTVSDTSSSPANKRWEEAGFSVGKSGTLACSDIEDMRTPRNSKTYSTRSSSAYGNTTVDNANNSPGSPAGCRQHERASPPHGKIGRAGLSACQPNTMGMEPQSGITVPWIANQKKGDDLLVSSQKEDGALRRSILHGAGMEELNSIQRATASVARSVGLPNGVCGTVRARVGGQSKGASNNVHVDMGKTTRSGRRSVPVLDWWRSQRLSSTPDGKVVVSVGSSPDELSSQRSMAPPHKIAGPKSSVAHAIAQNLTRPKIKGDRTSDGEAPLWTKAQLECLHVAHMGTAPTAKDFWDVVASSVEGKDPSECQQKWFEHFATPKVRRRQARTKGTSPQELGTPVAVKTPRSRILGTVDHDSVVKPRLPVTPQADADDLFQATPMRGRRRVRAEPAGSCSGPSTPKTPAGPGASLEDGGLVTEDKQGNGHDGSKRAVSRAYVQAMSKKMRKASANPRKIGGRICVRGQPPGKPRRVHATTLSRGRTIHASVASSGAVNVTSAGSDDSESEVSSSDGSDSDNS